ncbi:MAG: hypothetical protein ACAI44_35260 [Candidatus Sericytochromatia bacterium]
MAQKFLMIFNDFLLFTGSMPILAFLLPLAGLAFIILDPLSAGLPDQTAHVAEPSGQGFLL